MKDITLTKKEILEHPNDSDLGEYARTKADDTLPDVCVVCGKTSPYPRNTHIEDRIGYVEGGGQGCFQPAKCNPRS